MMAFSGVRARHREFPDSVTEADVLAGHGAKRPNKIALIAGDQRVSYGLLDERANRVANGLAAMGLTPKSRVAVMTKNCAEYFELFYGVVRAGFVMMPVNWRLAPPEIAFVLLDSEVECLFYDEFFANVIQEVRAHGVDIRRCIPMGRSQGNYAEWRDLQPATPFRGAADPEDVMIQFYTSGTTGHPKGVEISHRSSINMRSMEVESDDEWACWSDRDVAIVALPNFHLSGTSWAVQWLSRGAACVIQPQVDATAFLQAIEEHGVTQTMSIPTVIQMMLESPLLATLDISSLRNIFYGGMPMPAPLLRRALAALKCNFIQIYGMTENNGTICYLPPAEHLGGDTDTLKSAGRPLPSISLRIMDSTGNDVPQGEVGEVCLKSPSLMSGYWKLPEKSAEAMFGEYYRTGDGGYLNKEGYLFLVDRLKDMIVSGGENVYPAEVERVLQEHPKVAEISVVGIPDARWGEAVLAVVVRKDESLDGDELLNFARGKMAGYKIPKTVKFVDSLPRNANGKILKRDLRERYAVE